MSRGRRAAWDAEWRHPNLTFDWKGLTTQEHRNLNNAVDRVQLGISPFDTHAKVPPRTYRHSHEIMTSQIFGRQLYPVYLHAIDHSPG